MKTLLDSIAKKHGTDKSSLVHNYCVKYEKYLPFDRSDKIRILEIGVLGGQSLKTWEEYYYRSEIIGIDINQDCRRYEDKNIHIEIGSQNDGTFLLDIIDKYIQFDMILDDGSHINSDVIFSFEHLFSSLKSGGVYIVEDASTSYWPDYGGKYKGENTIMEYFKALTDDVSFLGIVSNNPSQLYYRKEDDLIKKSIEDQINIRLDIESINFLNSLILITKR